MEAGKLLTCNYANRMLHLHLFFFMDCNVVLGCIELIVYFVELDMAAV